MLHHLKSYVNFLWKSKNQYGVHSPFVYDFFTKGIRSKPGKQLQPALDYRKKLKSNKAKITVKDHGAGSRIFKGQEREVGKIASTAGINKKWGELLFKTTLFFKPNRILELGTSLGISSSYMATAAPDAQVISLEGCPATAGTAQKALKEFGFSNIEIRVGEFETTLPEALKQDPFDLVFFDGNHQKKATLDYFGLCIEHAKETSIFIFDDIHWSREMEAAWNCIINHPKVTLSIDCYQWGMAFFHKERAKEHFVLRF